MFLCTQCQEQFENDHLAYTLILESRLTHPAHAMFVQNFCSQHDLQEYLTRIRSQHQRYLLVKKGPSGDRAFEPAEPLDLLMLVGSSKVS